MDLHSENNGENNGQKDENEIYDKSNDDNVNAEIWKMMYKSARKKSRFSVSVWVAIFTLIVGYLLGVITERADTSNGVLQSRKMEKLHNLIDKNYYFTDKIDHDAAAENAYGAYMGSFGDRFTYYIPPKRFDEFTESMTGNYVGIGVEVTVDSDNCITVTNSFENSPAYESGIEAGDLIVEVNGEKYTGDNLDDAIAVLKGHQGEAVNIKIYDFSEDTLKDVTVTRRAVVAQTVKSEMLENNIGYIRISSFGDTTYKEFEEHFGKLEATGMNGLIIDLRNNPGGTLDSVVKVADKLMPEDVIVRIKYKNRNDDVYNSDAECFDKKIVVLVNENTASAAELLSGALRDVNKAVLVGKNTYGKGVVGTVFPIDSDSAAVITTGEYFLPCGDNIHGIGIKPDVEADLPDTVENIYLLDKKDDTQLEKALVEFE